jgi:AcrR family transcriptional regulator
VPTRSESAAATREALLAAAAELLDTGGPEAVTLRAVGARAGVSRGAPYGHFDDKEHLLTQLAADSWGRLTVRMRDLEGTPGERLEQALHGLVDLGRRHPHLYALMFHIPTGDARALEDAVAQSQDVFLQLVADVVGEQDAREYGALLLSTTQGATAMELSGHLTKDKWGFTADRLVATLIRTLGRD